MNLRICWRTLHCPWGEVLFKSFHIKQKLSPPWVIYYRQILLSACVKEILLTAVRTGYQSITKNFIKWNLSRKPWQARNHPFISVCQLMSYVDSMFFFSFLSYPSSEQINHIFWVPTLVTEFSSMHFNKIIPRCSKTTEQITLFGRFYNHISFMIQILQKVLALLKISQNMYLCSQKSYLPDMCQLAHVVHVFW